MNSRSALTGFCVTACTVLAATCGRAGAAELSVTVTVAGGGAVAGAVVLAEPANAPRARHGLKAVMDQRNLQFVPEVLVVQTGTAVEFPNSDQVRHQVYSFSGAKTFQLALYAGRTHPPVVFDRAGLVTLGCNIHDSMLGFIYVTDSPWYGRTDTDGVLRLHDVPAGDYTVRIWHPLLDESGAHLEQHLSIDGEHPGSAVFRLRRPLRQPLMHHGGDKKWDDY
jgi:plastocyanin